MTDDPDKLPTADDPRGQCSRCGFFSNFGSFGSPTPLRRAAGVRLASGEQPVLERAHSLRCFGCNEQMLVVSTREVTTDDSELRFTAWEPIMWWPPVSGGVASPAVPPAVSKWFDEGMRCLGAGAPNGAATMFRNAMVYLVIDKGSDDAKNKGDLKGQVKKLVEERSLSDSLGPWVDHVRLAGNAGAHPDKFGEVDLEEAQELAGLIKSLFEVLYIIPQRIADRQSKRFAGE